jgi:hypothetical protein
LFLTLFLMVVPTISYNRIKDQINLSMDSVCCARPSIVSVCVLLLMAIVLIITLYIIHLSLPTLFIIHWCWIMVGCGPLLSTFKYFLLGAAVEFIVPFPYFVQLNSVAFLIHVLPQSDSNCVDRFVVYYSSLFYHVSFYRLSNSSCQYRHTDNGRPSTTNSQTPYLT